MTETQDFQLQTTQLLEASCLFSFKSFTYLGKISLYQTNSVYVKLYLYSTTKVIFDLKISVQRPFKIASYQGFLF